jgi:PPOX class probable F420-dependent enzyme
MTVFSSRICKFLDTAGRFAVLATTNPDGTAHQSVVWYERRGQTIVVNALDRRRWAANARRARRLSAAIVDAYEYVIVSGPVEVIDEQQTAQADIRALARRYRNDDGAFEGQHRVTFVIQPKRVAVHGALARE